MTETINNTDINAICASSALDLSTVNGQITTTSQQVAERFGKNHKDVLRAIRSLECSADFYQLNFAPVIMAYTNGKGGVQKATAYRITRDGFMFLAMGFTGEGAAKWKEAYITAFNTMEAALRAGQNTAALKTQDQLQLEVQSLRGVVRDHKQEIDCQRIDYIALQSALIGSQGHEIKLLRQVQSLRNSREAQQAKLTMIQMHRDGRPNAEIVAATGRNLNHVRQVLWQAREKGVLPPLPASTSTQATLFAEVA